MQSPPRRHSSSKSPRNVAPSERSESSHFSQRNKSISPGNRHSRPSGSTRQSSPIIYYNVRTPGRVAHSEKSNSSHFAQDVKSMSAGNRRSKSPVTKRRSSSPHHRKSYSPRSHDRLKSPKRTEPERTGPSTESYSPRSHDRLKSPKRTEPERTGPSTKSYSPRSHERLKSPKRTEPERTGSFSNSGTKSNTEVEKYYRDTASLRSLRISKEDPRTSRSDRNRTQEKPAALLTIRTEDAQKSKAERDLLQQGLGVRATQYCDITDEMVLVIKPL